MTDSPDIRRPLVIGTLIVLLFFGIFLGWSILSPLESAAVALGEVGAVGKQKDIAHLEGGIVQEILVKDGDRVEPGQVLVRMDETQPKANLALISGRHNSALALHARLIAERDGQDEILFPAGLLESADDNVSDMLVGQRNIFSARRTGLEKKRHILNQRIAQSRAEIKGLRGAIQSQDEQLEFVKEEVAAFQSLKERGVPASKTRILVARKDYARVEGDRSKNVASIARAQQEIGETELYISNLDIEQLNEVVEQLRQVQNEMFDLDEQLRAAKDVLERTEIRAPIPGIVVGLQVYTVGGVIGPGESILGIVPSDEKMVVEARMDPQDIDIVRPGLPAHVRFTAFSSRTHTPIEAKVVTVSADRFTDERTGAAYYKVEVALTGDVKAALRGESLYPGMQAEVMIVTGSRTPMEYLLEPLTESINRAFRES